MIYQLETIMFCWLGRFARNVQQIEPLKDNFTYLSF